MTDSKNIFQIEDEPLVPALSKVVVEMMGHTYLGFATNLDEAKAKLNDLADNMLNPVHGLLLDHKFPPHMQSGESAEEVIRYVLSEQQKGVLRELKAIVLLSGDAQQSDLEALQGIAPHMVMDLLRKPFEVAKLQKTLAGVLSRASVES